VPPSPTPRAVARAAQIATIKAVAQRLIAERGVAGLSLREVAREMGLVSSALYRYYASRDELLTALILDAYNDLGAAVERADARHAGESARQRWRVAARAIRTWAKRHPHQYGLLYGTPVPDYQAPPLTIEAATRSTRVLCNILSDDRRAGGASVTTSSGRDVRRFLMVDGVAAMLPGVAEDDYLAALMAWTHIFGFVSFELFGHYVGSVRNATLMFDEVTDRLADLLDLSD
jgi:AcrR family transcriptional regulator